MTTVEPGQRRSEAAAHGRIRKRTPAALGQLLAAAGAWSATGPAADGSEAAEPRWWTPLLRRLTRPVPASLLAAAALHLIWLWLFANSGGDLAAQDAWAEFAGRHPDSAYNLAWYGGMHPVSYSVISPYLMAVLGVRSTMILAGTLSAGLLALLIQRCGWVRRPLVPALWGAFALACNAASGRVTFALGLLFALGAMLLVFVPGERLYGPGTPDAGGPKSERPPGWPGSPALRGTGVVLLSALSTAGSPVAGLFIEVVAAALFLQKRRSQAYTLAVAPPVMVALSAWLFPFQGVQPMPFVSGLLPILTAAVVFGLAPPAWRTVRIGSVIYGLGTLAAWIIPSQVGSNVERLALIFGGSVLLAAVDYNREERAGRQVRFLGLAFLPAVWISFTCVAIWQVTKPVVDVVLTTPNAAWTRELAPLVSQLKHHDTAAGRVEVVPVRSHREASALAPYVNLARGWNRQADTDRHALFYDGSLSPSTYHAWLKRWAVRYVVLPVEDRPDTGAQKEARIVSAGQPYLNEVWGDANWRLYQVRNPTPLVEPPASARRADEGELIITVRRPGEVLVRVPWSPWLGLVDRDGKPVDKPKVLDDVTLDPADPDSQIPADSDVEPEWSDSGKAFLNRDGCLNEAGDWTRLRAPHPGVYRIAAPYQLPRGTACPD